MAITSYDEAGRKLTSQVASLDPGGPTFIYGRSIDEKLIVHTSPKLWAAKSSTPR